MTSGSDGGRGESDFDFGPFLQRYLAGDEQALKALPVRERELALKLAPAFDPERDATTDAVNTDTTSTAGQAPPLELDPIAIALGLVPGPDDVLSSHRLQSARKAARIDLSELVRLLQDRGWDVSATEVLRWHSADTQLAPALLNALAETLDVPVRSLRGKRARTSALSLGAFLDDAIIANYLAEWAHETGEDPAGVREHAQRTLASLSFRNQATVSRDDVLAILRALRRIDPGSAIR